MLSVFVAFFPFVVSDDIIFSDPISYSGRLLEKFEEFSKRLRSIEDIPLRISSVQPLDSGILS